MDHNKTFIDKFNSLVGKYRSWRIWDDFINMAACAISNSTDKAQYEKREEAYMDRVKNYTKEEANIISELLGITTLALDANSEQDFLGQLFMEMDLGSHWQGQFFTPYDFCKLMSVMTWGDTDQLIKDRGYVTVNDCAVGAGALLIAFANMMEFKGYNYQRQALFVAQDVDRTAAMMCYIQMSLLGMPGYVIIGDTLAKPGFHPDNEVWYTPMYFLNTWHRRGAVERVKDIVNEIEILPVEEKEEQQEGQLVLF